MLTVYLWAMLSLMQKNKNKKKARNLKLAMLLRESDVKIYSAISFFFFNGKYHTFTKYYSVSLYVQYIVVFN